jgi:hypothetical protein
MAEWRSNDRAEGPWDAGIRGGPDLVKQRSSAHMNPTAPRWRGNGTAPRRAGLDPGLAKGLVPRADAMTQSREAGISTAGLRGKALVVVGGWHPPELAVKVPQGIEAVTDLKESLAGYRR